MLFFLIICLQVFPVNGIYIYQFNSPLYFANVSVFRSKLYIKTGIDPEELVSMEVQGCIQYGCAKVKIANLITK